MRSLLAALTVGLAFGALFVLRYLGYWAENDTTVFSGVISALVQAGHLQDGQPYTHGYAYQAWAATLVAVTGLDLTGFLQLYSPLLGNLLLALFGYAAFRRYLGSDTLGVLAATVLFLVPELVFTVSRGNHEKFTVSLTLLAALALLRSFVTLTSGARWSLFAAWVVVYYLAAFTLVSLNVFFGSTFIVACTLALAVASVLTRVPRLAARQTRLRGLSRRLTLTVAASWGLVVLVLLYLYPPAASNFGVLHTTLEKLSTLFLSFTPESNPYSVVESDWHNLAAYRLLSAFRWLLFLGSFVTWLILLGRALRTPGDVPFERWILLALYGALGAQLALAIPVDLLGLSAGSNLQVRLYTYFALFSAPLFTLGLVRLAQVLRARVPAPLVTAGLGLALSAFAGLSVLKATLEPTFSNRWLLYRPAEVQALQFWSAREPHTSLWIGREGRVAFAFLTSAQVSRAAGVSLDVADASGRSAFALDSPLRLANDLMWQEPLPTLLLGNRIYDNGGAQLLRRLPTTPFQEGPVAAVGPEPPVSPRLPAPATPPGEDTRAEPTTAAGTATRPPGTGALERGQHLTRLLYSGRLEQVWAAFSPSARAAWNGFASFQAYRAGGRRLYGAETRVVKEEVVREGDLTYYIRTATFERGPRTGWALIFGLDAQGRVQEFGIVAADLLPKP